MRDLQVRGLIGLEHHDHHDEHEHHLQMRDFEGVWAELDLDTSGTGSIDGTEFVEGIHKRGGRSARAVRVTQPAVSATATWQGPR